MCTYNMIETKWLSVERIYPNQMFLILGVIYLHIKYRRISCSVIQDSLFRNLTNNFIFEIKRNIYKNSFFYWHWFHFQVIFNSLYFLYSQVNISILNNNSLLVIDIVGKTTPKYNWLSVSAFVSKISKD